MDKGKGEELGLVDPFNFNYSMTEAWFCSSSSIMIVEASDKHMRYSSGILKVKLRKRPMWRPRDRQDGAPPTGVKIHKFYK